MVKLKITGKLDDKGKDREKNYNILVDIHNLLEKIEINTRK